MPVVATALFVLFYLTRWLSGGEPYPLAMLLFLLAWMLASGSIAGKWMEAFNDHDPK